MPSHALRPSCRRGDAGRLQITALALFGAVVLTGLPAQAQIKVEKIEIEASSRAFYSDFGQPAVDLVSSDYQHAMAPHWSFKDEDGSAKSGVAQSIGARPGLVEGRALYAAAMQRSNAGAVAAQTVATSGVDVRLEAYSVWVLHLRNHGTEPAPVDFSFFVAGGGFEAHCTACLGGDLFLETGAFLWQESGPDHWQSITQFVSTPGHAELYQGSDAGSRDNLGIGFPSAAIVDHPDESDPFHRASIDPFLGHARLLTLDPDEHVRLVFLLQAFVAGSSGAFGTAWLVDPFSLGEAPPGLASSRFAINGVPVSTLIPEPAPWLSMLMGLLAGKLLHQRAGHGAGLQNSRSLPTSSIAIVTGGSSQRLCMSATKALTAASDGSALPRSTAPGIARCTKLGQSSSLNEA